MLNGILAAIAAVSIALLLWDRANLKSKIVGAETAALSKLRGWTGSYKSQVRAEVAKVFDAAKAEVAKEGANVASVVAWLQKELDKVF